MVTKLTSQEQIRFFYINLYNYILDKNGDKFCHDFQLKFDDFYKVKE